MKAKHMNIEDLREILNYIERNHSFRHGEGKRIKYVDPTIDMRIGSIFAIGLRGSYGEQVFSITNENKDRDLKAWIYEWLNEDVSV